MPNDVAPWKSHVLPDSRREAREIIEQSGGAQEAVRVSEERYRSFFDASPIAMWLFDAETLALFEVNDKATEVYGYTRDELLSMRVTDLKPENDHAWIVGSVHQTVAGATYSAVHVHRRKDGTLLDAQITSRCVMVRGRRAMLAFIVDVTKTRQLEEQLRQAQKMEAIGQLAGGVAHDFNNILAVILNDADLALEVIPTDHPAREMIEEIAAATARASALTMQLLTFSRRTPDRLASVELDVAVSNVTKMLSRLIGENIRVVSRLDAPAAAIVVSSSKLEQVLLNLSVNARDAMPDGGTLSIETRVVTLDDTSAAAIGLAQGEFVTLTVRDDGCGMDAATRARIFEPFFTTKAVGKGTGLGLSTAFGIVQQSGGAITVTSAPGAGTSFVVYFPKDAGDRRSIRPAANQQFTGNGETILVVEDEASLRTVIRRVLSSRGYRVIEASGPVAALDIMERPDTHVDLVLTDLVMPEMDGRTMALEMMCARPSTRIVYMSGYTEHVAVKGGPIGSDEAFLAKPFTPNDLSAIVQRALQDAAPVVGAR